MPLTIHLIPIIILTFYTYIYICIHAYRQVDLAVSPVIIDEQVNLKTLSYMHTDNFTSCCMPVLPLRFACEAGGISVPKPEKGNRVKGRL